MPGRSSHGQSERRANRPVVAAGISPWLRRTFVFAAALVFVTGLQLVAVTDRTDEYFAWTIEPPLTAAFLGAGYWAACALLAVAGLERYWANVRAAVVAVGVFVPLMFSATLVHLDRFHLGAGSATARAAGWGWLVFYVVVVVVVPAAVAVQLLTVRGGDPPRSAPLTLWVRAVLAAHGLALVGIGIPLYAAPGDVATIWPWDLTPLTGRAVASWLIGVGIAALASVRENDYVRLRTLFAVYVLLGCLHLVGVLRYLGTLDWNGAGSWLYVAFLSTMVALGAHGWRRGSRARRAAA
jgi:hypothetical protein